MARYHGYIGFVTTSEVTPGVWQETATEKNYFGDITKNSFKWQQGVSTNDDIQIMNTVSIVADDYCTTNLGYMRYVCWMGARWKISSVEVQYPRLLITLGGLYNGVTPSSSN